MHRCAINWLCHLPFRICKLRNRPLHLFEFGHIRYNRHGLWHLSASIQLYHFCLYFSTCPSFDWNRHHYQYVSIGFLVDFFRGVFVYILPSQPSVLFRIFVMLCGIAILSFAAALYIYPQLGISPYDSIGFILAERTHIQFRWCRIFCDVLAVLIGFLCGSIVGVGTVITAFCIGPLIKYFGDQLQIKIPLQFD